MRAGGGDRDLAPLFSVTLVKLVPRPRIETLTPSPSISRLMVTPGMRFSNSAMLVSGNLPMSSAKTESVKLVESRLASVAFCKLTRHNR